MTKFNAALACAAAFSLMASADSSYIYTAGDTGSGAVAITYDEGTTNIKTLTANTAGDTISISGDPITFAADATITLASSGTVSFAQKVTTLGATTLVRGDDAYKVWTGTALTTADRSTPEFPDIYTNDTFSAEDVNNTWECIHVIAGVAGTSGYDNIAAAGRYDRILGGFGTSSFVTLNRTTSAFTYSIRVQLSPRYNGTFARCRTGTRSPRRGLYPDLDDSWEKADIWGMTGEPKNQRGIWGTSDKDGNDAQKYGGIWIGYVSAMGLNKIILKRKAVAGGTMHVRFDGGASLGGTTTIPFGMEAVLAVSDGIDSATVSSAIEGDGDFKIEPMALGSTSSYYREDFLPTSWTVLVTNRLLSAVTTMSGEMQGGSQTTTQPARWCHYKFDSAANTAKCQFQFWNGTGIKTVKVDLRQNGKNIEIKASGAGYYTGSQYNYNINEPVDVYSLNNTHTVATSATTGNYGIHKVTVTTRGKGDVVTIDGNLQNLIGGKLVLDGGDGGYLRAIVTSTTGFPAGGEVHVNTNVETWLQAGSTAPSGGTPSLIVHTGGRLRNINAWQVSRPQHIVLAGGTYAGNHTDAYLNYVTLSNATMNSTYARVAYDVPTQYWRVIGTEPSEIVFSNGLNIYGYGSAATARSQNCAFRIEVANVTDGPDCIVNQLRGAANRGNDRESFTWFWFEKHGLGTMKVTGDSKELRMESKLYNGTLLLAGSDIMTNEVQLLGGNIAIEAGKSNNNLGQLTASKPGMITVGEGGSLAFASFAPDANLAKKSIMIDASLRENAVKFAVPLTGEQRTYFRWKDDTALNGSWRVSQDANGYLHPVMQGAVIYLR